MFYAILLLRVVYSSYRPCSNRKLTSESKNWLCFKTQKVFHQSYNYFQKTRNKISNIYNVFLFQNLTILTEPQSDICIFYTIVIIYRVKLYKKYTKQGVKYKLLTYPSWLLVHHSSVRYITNIRW